MDSSINKKIIPDLLTGDKQTVYWNNDGTFFMSIPHKGIPLPTGYIPAKYKTTKNNDGSQTFELISTAAIEIPKEEVIHHFNKIIIMVENSKENVVVFKEISGGWLCGVSLTNSSSIQILLGKHEAKYFLK